MTRKTGMRKSIVLVVLAAAFAECAPAARAQVIAPGRTFPNATTEVSIAYSLLRANAGPGQCGCFYMNGGNAEASFRAYRSISAVVDVTGLFTGNIHNTGQPFSLLVFSGGPRIHYRIHDERFRAYRPFAQALLGGAYGFNSAFPSKSGYVQSSATSLALFAGLGLDIKLRRAITLRAIQADYGLTHLPNNANNQQNLLRISSGITLYFRPR